MARIAEPLPYGDAALIWHDGTIEVERADNRIGVHHDLWAAAGPEHRIDDQTLVLDTAGEYRYRLVGEVPSYTDPTQTVLVFERITDEATPGGPGRGETDEVTARKPLITTKRPPRNPGEATHSLVDDGETDEQAGGARG